MPAVTTGIKFENAFVLPTPSCRTEKVKKINAKEDPKIANSSKGTHASDENPFNRNSLKSIKKNRGANKKIPIVL